MTQDSIVLSGLTKRFGKLTAVDSLSFSVKPGEVLGFLGPNGAGKTTAMRMLVGLLTPTEGSATVLGFDVRKRDKQMLADIGYLPGAFELYENLTGIEFLHFLAKMRKKDCSENISKLAAKLNVDLHRHIHDLSKGNRQKLGVISAFMHEPKVLILDEPTSGLDPIVQREFEGILREATGRGAAVLLSSHVLSEVEHLSNRIAIINHGKLVVLDDISTLKTKALRRVEFSFENDFDENAFRNLTGVSKVTKTGKRVLCEVTGSETELLKLAANLGASSVRTEEINLEEIFVGLIDDGDCK